MGKKLHPAITLGDAIDLCVETAARRRRPGITDLAQMQRAFADAAAALCRYYESGAERDAVIASLTNAITQAAYHRANVAKDHAPELPLGD